MGGGVRLVKEAIQEQADEEGMVELKFVRIYLVAKKRADSI